MLLLRRLVLLAVCAAVLVGMAAAYRAAYRAEVFAMYVARKVGGVQEPGEFNAELDARYAQLVFEQTGAPAAALTLVPSSPSVAAAAPDSLDPDRTAAKRVVQSAWDVSTRLDWISTGLTVLALLAIVAMVLLWRPRKRRSDDLQSMIETLAAQAAQRRARRAT